MRILLVRFSAIGDCVMAAYAVTALRERFPDAEIDWAVESRCLPVVDERRLARPVEVPRQRWKKEGWRSLPDQMRYYRGFRRGRYDLGIDLQGHSKTALLLRLAGPKRRIAAQGTDLLAKRLNPRIDFDHREMHQVEWFLRTVSALEPVESPGSPLMPPLAEERAKLASQVPDRLATISVGAGHADKRIAPGRLAEIGRGLQAAGLAVAYLGGPGDRYPEGAPGLDLVGKLSLRESMAAVALSAVHVAGDTGSSHLAAAYGVPQVTVFGPTNPVRYRPYSDRATVLRVSKDPNDVPVGEIVAAALARAEESETGQSETGQTETGEADALPR